MSIDDEDIRGTVLLYPALTLPDFINNRFQDDASVPDEFPLASITAGKVYVTDIRGLSMFDMIKKETKKILILHGTDDHTVPVSVSERAVATYKNSELHTIDGAGHGFSDAEVDVAMEYIIKYFKEIGVI
jgi:pimeloyl-ACP methyl ester carboxylesterase